MPILWHSNCAFSPNCLAAVSEPWGKKQYDFSLRHYLSRNNYIGHAGDFFFCPLTNFSYVGIVRCHCQRFLPSCRKAAFRAGQATRPWSIERCEDRNNLGQLDRGVKTAGSAISRDQEQRCCATMEGRPAQVTKLKVPRLALSQEKSSFWKWEESSPHQVETPI